ncbi:hypothetical protein EDD16DRAFT_317717 [Pisolithus croceorrhizus]|nr:hypothetical protein EDD16DRAFT_317717 [Pisolithus croceorrhizus]
MAIAYSSALNGSTHDACKEYASTWPPVHPARTPAAPAHLARRCSWRKKTIVLCPFSFHSHSPSRKMAAVGKVYSVPGQTIVLRAAVARMEPEEPVYKHYEDNGMPEFFAKFPYGRIPASRAPTAST